MKTLLTLVFALSIGMAFADGKGCCAGGGCCGDKTFKSKAFDKKDAEFLEMANHMAMNAESKKKEKDSCCAAPKAKPAKKVAKRAR